MLNQKINDVITIFHDKNTIIRLGQSHACKSRMIFLSIRTTQRSTLMVTITPITVHFGTVQRERSDYLVSVTKHILQPIVKTLLLVPEIDFKDFQVAPCSKPIIPTRKYKL